MAKAGTSRFCWTIRLVVLCVGCSACSVLPSCGANEDRRAQRDIPLPKPLLLQRQPQPDCAVIDRKAVRQDQQPQAGTTGELSQRVKLEYERECYRSAELAARERLLQLQKAVEMTIRAVKRSQAD
jgi:hypothetical protein